MKALNSKDITRKYLVFLLNFTVLLAVTVVCCFFYLKADHLQSRMIIEQKKTHEYIFTKRQELALKIDSLNSYLSMLNTEQVANEAELERKIVKLKNTMNAEVELLKSKGDPSHYELFAKIISNVEKAIDNKHALQQALTEEEIQKKRLTDCIDANKKVKKELISGN